MLMRVALPKLVSITISYVYLYVAKFKNRLTHSHSLQQQVPRDNKDNFYNPMKTYPYGMFPPYPRGVVRI